MRRTQVGYLLNLWEEQLFYPRLKRYGYPEKDLRIRWGAGARAKIRAVVRRTPEVMVKVTGGGRGMGGIKAHMVYMSRHGELSVEDERGDTFLGKEALADLAEEWRFAGAEIPTRSHRREAFHVMLSMPADTDPQAVLGAVREFARAVFPEHKFAMVLHEPGTDPDTKRPHVHLIVRAMGADGKRLNPRKADLARWREVFAERLRERGIAANATRRQTRGELKRPKKLWEHHVEGMERGAPPEKPSERAAATEDEVLRAWRGIAEALVSSEDREDQALAREVLDFVREMPSIRRRETLLRKFKERNKDASKKPSVERSSWDRDEPVTPPGVPRGDRERER